MCGFLFAIFFFQVSPVLSGKLDYPKEKEPAETPVESNNSAPKLQSPQQAPALVNQTPPPEPSVPVQQPPAVEQKSATTSETATRKNSVASEPNKEEKSGQDSTTETSDAPVCGPEMINTLEQLKISLDNLKHSGHVAHKKENSEQEVKKSTSGVDVSGGGSSATQVRLGIHSHYYVFLKLYFYARKKFLNKERLGGNFLHKDFLFLSVLY